MDPQIRVPIPRQNEARFEETKRIARIFRMVQLISAQPSQWRRAVLAEHFEVSERQIAKDLDLIRNGLRLKLERGPAGYAFSVAPQLPAVTFSFGEALAMYLAADAVRVVPGIDAAELLAALARLGAVFPAEIQRALARRALSIPAAVDVTSRRRGELLNALHKALFDGHVISLRYASAARGGAVVERRVRPYAVLPHGRAWYLVAFCELRQAVLVFKVDRIERLESTTDRFEVPLDFDLDGYFAGAWGIVRDEGAQPEEIVLEFDSTAARWVAEEFWHVSQEIDPLQTGGIRFRVYVPPTPELTRWVLGYGRHVRVLEPDGLRRAVRAEADAVVSLGERREVPE